MKSIKQAGARTAAAAVICAALGLPGAALASPGGATARSAITVYVANQISNTVTPISAATNKPGRAIALPPGGFPTAMAITPDGRTVYVGDSTGDPSLGYVTPISTATNRALPSIQIVGSPGQIVFTPNGRTGYVTAGSNTVIPFSTATNKQGKPIKVTQAPDGIAITPNGKTAYVSAY